jgi:opacity protein-like surface antigen
VKRNLLLYLMIYSLILIFPALSHGETTPNEIPKVEETQNEATHVEVSKVETRTREWGIALGLRSTYFQMTQNHGQFVGAVNYLPEEQNYLPINPLIQLNLSKYFALEFGYDQFKVGTLNSAFSADGVNYSEHDPRFKDGDVQLDAFMLALQFRWPHFHKSLVPYVLGGVSYIKTSWVREDWYYYGFPFPWVYDDWTGQGNRPQDYPNNGYRRIYDVDDHTFGILLGLGVDYFIWKNLALNLDWRYHWAKVNFTYSLAWDDGQTVFHSERRSFPLDSWILGLGLKYYF